MQGVIAICLFLLVLWAGFPLMKRIDRFIERNVKQPDEDETEDKIHSNHK